MLCHIPVTEGFTFGAVSLDAQAREVVQHLDPGTSVFSYYKIHVQQTQPTVMVIIDNTIQPSSITFYNFTLRAHAAPQHRI